MRKKIIIAIICICIVTLIVGIIYFQYLAPSGPGVPTDFTTSVMSRSRIDLTWTKGDNADTTYIERNSVSSWSRGKGTLIYNDTGVSYQDIGLFQSSHYYYQAWSWNQTDNTFSTTFASDDITFGNQPPIFDLPNPVNGSTNDPLSLTWNIAINDPEGDAFSWTIQCSNGQSTSGTGASNGTKSLVLSGLTNSTSYRIWVNATDPTGSGLYTRRWFTFTTKAALVNTPPVFGVPSPANGSTGNLLSLTWGIPINDPQGNFFSWTIQCSNGQKNNGTGASNGTKSLVLSGLTNSTSYRIWVNATDPTGSGLYTRKWYTFTTQQQNFPPNKPNTPSGNNSGKIKTVYTYTTSTTDPNGDQVYYLWDWGDGNNSSWLGPYNSGVTTNTTHKWIVKGSYSIKVKAKDIHGKESDWSDPLPIKMPYTFNPMQKFFDWLFQRFPNAFPILRQLMEY
jgi:hypothetical protein